jgi:hypothetical protein
MHIGNILHGKGTGVGVTVYTPWFPRGGDNARFAYEIIDDTSSDSDTNFVVDVFTKKSEDSGDGASIGAALSSWATVPSGSRFREATATGGMQDLVRFEIQIIGEETPAWYLYRFLTPVWYEKAGA